MLTTGDPQEDERLPAAGNIVRRMDSAARVVQTGVRIEPDPDPEPEVRERIACETRAECAGALRAELEAYRRGEVVYVRGIAFVDVELDGEPHRWEWTPSPATAVAAGGRATSALVDLAAGVEATARGGLLSDARVAGLRVSRWDVESAPRRIELDAELAARLVLD